MNFAHTPLADQPGAGPYPVTAVVTYNGPFGALSGTPTLYYALNNGGFNPVAMSPDRQPERVHRLDPGRRAARWCAITSAPPTPTVPASTEPDNAPAARRQPLRGRPGDHAPDATNMESDPGWTVGRGGRQRYHRHLAPDRSGRHPGHRGHLRAARGRPHTVPASSAG